MKHIGEDRAPQPALDAVQEHGGSEQQGRADEGRTARFTGIATNHGRVAPDFVVEPSEDGRGERDRRPSSVLAGEEWEEPGGGGTSPDRGDGQPGERNR